MSNVKLIKLFLTDANSIKLNHFTSLISNLYLHHFV